MDLHHYFGLSKSELDTYTQVYKRMGGLNPTAFGYMVPERKEPKVKIGFLGLTPRRGRGFPVSILGKEYESIKHANKATGLSPNVLKRHTEDGVFNVEEYRFFCRRRNITPKV